MNPVKGGRPLIDNIKRARERVVVVEVVHVVDRFCSVFVAVFIIIRKIGVVVMM